MSRDLGIARQENDLLAVVRETVGSVIEKHMPQIEKRIEEHVDIVLVEYIEKRFAELLKDYIKRSEI